MYIKNESTKVLNHKIDFVSLVGVVNANPNGDPLNGNHPRINFDGYGEISAECIHRKIRNRLQDMGYHIFVQSDERIDDDCNSMQARANKFIGKPAAPKKAKNGKKDDGLTPSEYIEKACDEFVDVRTFGQVFAYSSEGKKKGDDEDSGESESSNSVSVSVRGPVTTHIATTVSPVEEESFQIVKSTNSMQKYADEGKRGPDTMGMRHFVRFGLYVIKGSINVQLAEKSGFTEDDALAIKEALRTMFVNDASAARPDGSMEVVKLFWFEHNNKIGQYSSAKVHRSIQITQKDPKATPKEVSDYEINVLPLDGLTPEILEGM